MSGNALWDKIHEKKIELVTSYISISKVAFGVME
jgi:hypothetical protein